MRGESRSFGCSDPPCTPVDKLPRPLGPQERTRWARLQWGRHASWRWLGFPRPRKHGPPFESCRALTCWARGASQFGQLSSPGTGFVCTQTCRAQGLGWPPGVLSTTAHGFQQGRTAGGVTPGDWLGPPRSYLRVASPEPSSKAHTGAYRTSPSSLCCPQVGSTRSAANTGHHSLYIF